MFTLLLGAFFLHLPATLSAADTVCARVKIEIKQELSLERQGFDAMMKITNGLDTAPIENVNVAVNFTDEAGNSVRATSSIGRINRLSPNNHSRVTGCSPCPHYDTVRVSAALPGGF